MIQKVRVQQKTANRRKEEIGMKEVVLEVLKTQINTKLQ